MNPNDVGLYFIEKRSNNDSCVQKLHLDEFGNISNWPEGFFDENFNEIMKIKSILLKKRNEQIEW
ncbi:DUF3696 domain-containing protein [Clostridium novyi]|uniref:DUF3696 domain-containing protein n=1 Tax=Clostridium novyi TaxID=1542 RepID=UPI003B8A6D80